MTTVDDALTAAAPPPALDLAGFYRPRSLAVVGAHDTREPGAGNTRRLLAVCEALGATAYLVNPKIPEIFGHPTYPSMTDLPEQVDVMVVQIGDPVAAVEAAIPARPRFTVVFSSGFAELGTDEGRTREAALLEACRRAGTRLFGPNTNINSLETRRDLPPPKLGLVTQSGMQGRPIVQGEELGIAFSYWATTGNEADLGAADFLEFMARDPDTRALAAYVEGFTSGQRLREAALAALENDAPVILVKVGRTDTGASMAASHTAHLSGSDAVHDAFFQQYGMTRVDDLDELLEVSTALARCGVPPADGVVLSCVSGGTAAHLSDLAAAAGLPLPELPAETQARLHELIPPYLRVSNPIDNGGTSLIAGNGPAIMDVIMSEPSVGLVIAPITGVFPGLAQPTADALIHARRTSGKPLLVVWSGPTTADPTYQQLLDAGLPVLRNFRNAIRAAQALLERRRWQRRLPEFAAAVRALPPVPDRPYAGELTSLDEAASAAWLGARGVPYIEHRVVTTPDEAVAAAEELGFPVALKGRGAALAHKSELGLVELGLAGVGAVRAAADALTARGGAGLDGFLVARMAGRGVELIAGISHDPVLGPVVLVGAGGIEAEAAKDVAVAVLPLTRERAEQALASLRIAPLLDGWRGRPAVDRDAIVDVLLRLADIAAAGEAEEVDVNPLLAGPAGVVALDALVRLRAGSCASSLNHV